MCYNLPFENILRLNSSEDLLYKLVLQHWNKALNIINHRTQSPAEVLWWWKQGYSQCACIWTDMFLESTIRLSSAHKLLQIHQMWNLSIAEKSLASSQLLPHPKVFIFDLPLPLLNLHSFVVVFLNLLELSCSVVKVIILWANSPKFKSSSDWDYVHKSTVPLPISLA